MRRFLCQTCNKQLRITDGDNMFSFNINCCNNHKNENIDIDYILSNARINPDIFKCQNHKKEIFMHCFNCDEDCCFNCYKSHQNHKIDYLNKLDTELYNPKDINIILTRENNIINKYISGIKDFQNRLNKYIDILLSEIKNIQEIRNELINNKFETKYTFIDIENSKIILRSNTFKQIIKNAEEFNKQDLFFKKYEHLKNILEPFIEKGKFIENINIKDNYNELKKMRIVPIDKNYFISFYTFNLKLMKINKNLLLKTFDYNSIYKYNLNFNLSDFIIKDNNNYKENLSFYGLSYKENNNNDFKTEVKEIIITDIFNNKKSADQKINIKNIQTIEGKIKLIILKDNKNIVINNNGIILYDNSFNNKKILDSQPYNHIYDTFKISENIFVFSTYLKAIENPKIYAFNVENDLIYKKIIKNSGYIFIKFSESKKIMFTHDTTYFYLISLNTNFPECIQKIEINHRHIEFFDLNYIKLMKFFNIFNDESIYFESSDNYLIQYKILENVLTEISKVKINNNQ